MGETDIELPEKWVRKSDEAQCSTAIVEFELETTDGTTFIVSVMPKTADESFELRLSTINSTSTPTQTRHNYPIAEYDELERALRGGWVVHTGVLRAVGRRCYFIG